MTRRTARLHNRRPCAKTNLGGENDLFASLAQRFAEHDFGLAAGVTIGGVEEVDAGIEAALDQRIGFTLAGLPDCAHLALVVAEGHDSKCETRNDEAAVAETGVLHDVRFRIQGFDAYGWREDSKVTECEGETPS
jgi:hypothetical protein